MLHNWIMKTPDHNDRLVGLLQGSGLRLTRQRLLLARLLFDGTHKHVTAEQVHASARKSRAHVSLATVYNTLHQFTSAGLLSEVVIDRNRIYFDTNNIAHYHFFDETSGQLTDIAANSVSFTKLPKIPPGSSLNRVDVVIHIRSDKNEQPSQRS